MSTTAGTKVCSLCRSEKTLAEMAGRSRTRGYCKACDAAKARERRERETPDQYAARLSRTKAYRSGKKPAIAAANRAHNYAVRYGITVEEYDGLLSRQGGVCAICRQPCRTGQRLTIDHDHDTGAIRGLLCRNCNAGLGNFNDDPGQLERALAYLREGPLT